LGGLVLEVLVSVLKTVDCFVEGLLTFVIGTTLRALVGTLVGNLVGFLVEDPDWWFFVVFGSFVVVLECGTFLASGVTKLEVRV